MKKILSTLVMYLILGICSVYSATITLTAHAVVNDHSTPGGGEVVVHAQTKKGGFLGIGAKWEAGTQGVISSYTYEGDKNNCSADLMTIYDGYYFYRWEKSDGTQLNAKNRPTNNAVSSVADHTVPTDEYHMYAVLKPVTVDNANDGTISVTDISPATIDGTVTFNVTGADDKDDFYEPTVEGEGFAYKSMSYANNNIITVTVTYTVQDKDNVNGDDPKQAYSATVTLRSRGDADGTQTKQATITATESLIPAFTLPANFDITPGAPALTTAPAEQSFTITPTNQVAAKASWDATLPQEAKDLGFSVENTGTAVTVKFTPKNDDYQEDISATLSIKGTYTDSSKKIITNTQSVSLSADKGSAVKIDGTTTASYDFETIEYTGQAHTHNLSYASSISNGLTHSWVNGKFEHAINDGTITITLPGTLIPGDYSDNLSVKYNDTEVATLSTSAKVRLAQPQIESKEYMSQVLLTWKNVYGAKQYILKSGETVIDISDVMTSEAIATASTTASRTISYSKMITAISDVPLSTGTEYPFTLTVVYGDDVNNINDATKINSSTIRVETGAPKIITQGDLGFLGMYTGTEKGAGDGGVYESFPYSKKRMIELNSIFDAGGNALFDELYIFGLTTNTSGGIDLYLPDAYTPCNAYTPLYIYTKNASGQSYDFSKKVDATTTRFDHENETSKKDKKLYFTGYCPFAYMGTSITQEGWMYFSGNNERVDLYLDNCDIRGRFKTATGINAGYSDKLTIGAGNNFMTGANSIFVFNSTNRDPNRPYKPHIHIRGNNHLKGQGGTIAEVWLYVPLVINSLYMQNVQYASAPISIKPNDQKGSTNLIMDDLWPAANSANEITNGFLRLDCYTIYGEPAERAPSIDMGSEYGSLTINGGQYLLRNAASDFNYTNNLAVSYRKYIGEFFGIDAASLYGFGGDMADCKVTINSGTFTMYPNVYKQVKEINQNGTIINDTVISGAVYYLDQDNFYDLRLPNGNGKSQINGGTFNGISNVLFVSEVMSSGKNPVNAAEYWLCLQDVPVTGTNAYGGAEFTIPAPFDEAYSDATPIYNLSTNGNMNNVTSANYYGAQSVNAADGTVRLLLPGGACNDDCENCEEITEAKYYNWATLAPEIELTVGTKKMTVGGPTEVPYAADDALIGIKVNNLLYADLVGMEGYSAGTSGGGSITLKTPNYVRGQATNVESYSVHKNLNILKTVEADTWYCFVAPFDIHDVTVLEIGADLTPYQKNDNPNNRNIAKEKQAESNLSIWESLYYAIFPTSDGRASSRTLPQILRDLSALYPLQHYDGTNLDSANYYLYQVANTIQEDETGENLKIKWAPVKPQDGVLMKKGQTYAIQFPYCPMCNDLATRTYYDYWTNKAILFHGVGLQEVNGTEYHTTILNTTNPASGTAILTGNSTLADYTLPSGYVHDMTDDFFTPQTNAIIKPTQGYMLYTPSVAKMPAHISRSGQIVYAEGETTDFEGVPTIGDRSTLMLFGAMDGFELLSLSDQLVTVYNLQGHIIFQQYMTANEQVYVATGAGIFVVRGESEAIKVIVE